MAEVATKTDNTKAVVQWKGEPITITFQDVKGLICPLATDQEVAIFLKTCQSLQLNPFANECFLIKYDAKDKAAFVISIDSYLKAAEVNHDYDGCEAGIILKDSGGKLEYREGAFILFEEKSKLAGGWAKVYRKDRSRPTFVAVNKTEAVKLTREGNPTRFWSEEKQPWMLRKTALKRALVEAFPSLFAGTLATAEIESDIEGELPRAFENNGKPDWRKFWAKVQDELQLTEEQVHNLLGVESVKEIVAKSSLEEAWNTIVGKIREKNEQQDITPTEEEFEFEEPVVLFDDEAIEVPVDMLWLNESLKTLKWGDVGAWIKGHYSEAKGKTIGEAIQSLTREHQEEFVKEVQKRLEANAKPA